jgi:hypothetical protein
VIQHHAVKLPAVGQARPHLLEPKVAAGLAAICAANPGNPEEQVNGYCRTPGRLLAEGEAPDNFNKDYTRHNHITGQDYDLLDIFIKPSKHLLHSSEIHARDRAGWCDAC